ncbi:PD-(D/E)XK nuclease family protein [Flavobacterium sp. CYK-4]|uniref:PD-(D/E)XK nuclease family protein n=1 Tax=Flavobacterium lotistagni TaxID=2709660 RepID=UPI00140E8B00|nr:PD-(D/E)XK nuclease family protein [Flavobacterium lotistagni]NHM08046.1 PD-(D/E)XK nuclease family protein [Flavobacterium lotistagni]
MNLQALATLVDQGRIPRIERRIGFLEVINKAHHENINSAVYAHFLSCGIPGVETLFRDTLTDLVYSRTQKQLNLSQSVVSTEVKTPMGGRLDLVIEDFHNQNIILIENKIHHYLHNDLSDYWNYSNLPDARKVGILLTLYPHPIPTELNGKFINITHREWMQAIKEQMQSNDLDIRYEIYLNDFINTLENLTNRYAMNKSAQFYFAHAQQVQLAVQTQQQAYDFLNNQLELIAQNLGWQTYGSSMNWRNFWDQHNVLDTYLTIITRDLINGKMTFRIILELNRADKEKAAEVRKQFANHPQLTSKEQGESKNTYLHFLCQDYSLGTDELKNFGELVTQKIQEDFADITLKVIQYLYPDKNISDWVSNFSIK